MPLDLPEKENLNDCVIDPITYRQVRDAFRMLSETFSLDQFSDRLLGVGEFRRFLGNKDAFPWNRRLKKGDCIRIQQDLDCLLPLPTRPTYRSSIIEHDSNAFMSTWGIEPGVTLNSLCLNLIDHTCMVVEALVVRGHLIANDNDTFTKTKQGRALQVQKALKPLTREKADKLIEKLVQAAKDFNASDSPYMVRRIWVFGSYLKGKPVLNDLDILYEQGPRYLPGETHQEWQQRDHEMANVRGYTPSKIWPYNTCQREPRLALRVSPYISMGVSPELLTQLQNDSEPVQVIFESDPPAAKA